MLVSVYMVRSLGRPLVVSGPPARLAVGGVRVRCRGSAGKGGSKGSSAQRTRRAKMLCGPCRWRGAEHTLGRPRERGAGVHPHFHGPRGRERELELPQSSTCRATELC